MDDGSSIGNLPLTEDEIGDRVRRYQQGDPTGIDAVVRHYQENSRRYGRSIQSSEAIDQSDAESAADEALFAAIRSWDPSRGVPFSAYFFDKRSTATRDEIARLAHPWVLTRQILRDAASVSRAATAIGAAPVGASNARTEGESPLPVPDAPRDVRESRPPFDRALRPGWLQRAQVDDLALTSLDGHDPATLRRTVARILGAAERVVEELIGAHAPPADRAILAAQQVRAALSRPAAPTSAELEYNLGARLTAVAALYQRRGTLGTIIPDFMEAIRARAEHTSRDQARALLNSHPAVHSLNAAPESDETGGDGLESRLPAPQPSSIPATMVSAVGQAVALLDPIAQTVLVLTEGLDDEPRLTRDTLARGLGCSVTAVRLTEQRAWQELREVSVRAHLLNIAPATRAQLEETARLRSETITAWLTSHAPDTVDDGAGAPRPKRPIDQRQLGLFSSVPGAASSPVPDRVRAPLPSAPDYRGAPLLQSPTER